VQAFNNPNLDEVLRSLRKSSSFVVMSKSFAKSLIGKEILQNINRKNGLVFSNTLPTLEKIRASLPVRTKEAINRISAFGGGATIDFAKSMMALLLLRECIPSSDTLTESEIIDSLKRLVPSSFIEFDAIPTLAGSGSEVTQYATVWKSNARADESPKCSFSSPLLRPQNVFHIQGISLSAPQHARISGAFDALGHSVESFFSKNSTDVSSEFALKGITQALRCLNVEQETWDTFEQEVQLFSLSTLGGQAISITQTNACHSISYPLTARFGVSHGFAVAASLGVYLEFARRECSKRFSQLEQKLETSRLIEIVQTTLDKHSVRNVVRDACGSASNFLKIRKAMLDNERLNTCSFGVNKDFIDSTCSFLFGS